MSGSNVAKLGIFAAFLAVGCGGSAEKPTGGESSAGAESTQYEGPIGSTDVEHGKELFTTSCDDCHPGGESDVGPSLIAEPHTAARIRQQIREGSGRMKPFSAKRVSDQDVEAILAFLASIKAVK